MTNTSSNKRNILGFTKFVYNNHSILSDHLASKCLNNSYEKRRLTIMSKHFQNSMLKTLAESVSEGILQEIMLAGMFSV